jgi:uncharacterized membrane protein
LTGALGVERWLGALVRKTGSGVPCPHLVHPEFGTRQDHQGEWLATVAALLSAQSDRLPHVHRHDVSVQTPSGCAQPRTACRSAKPIDAARIIHFSDCCLATMLPIKPGTRSLPMAKTISFAIMHLTVAFGVAYILTGSLVIGGAIALIEPAINTVAYVVHERFWDRKRTRDARAARTSAGGGAVLRPCLVC